MDKIKVLQLGNENWIERNMIPENIEFYFADLQSDLEDERYPKQLDLAFVERQLREEEMNCLQKKMRAYTVFFVEGVATTKEMEFFFSRKKGQWIKAEEIQNFLLQDAKDYYPDPYGEKFSLQNVSISRNFKGKVKWNGNYSIELEGDFGEEFTQILSWRNNIPLFEGQTIDLWLEYQKKGQVSIALSVIQFVNGSISKVQQTWEFSEENLKKIVQLENQLNYGTIFVSLLAKGTGSLELVALHDRYSRRGKGYFLPGGERFVTSKREEVFCYFDPGDMKPPLSVYFSGYKTRQGFEGYYMMKKMGGPFLLVAEPRLEGGAFYIGSKEYEQMLASCIRKYMQELGFSSDQVILSGISMGTTGALYYGCDIQPHAIIIGKPLVSMGNIAYGEKRLRPGGFPTSLDVLMYNCGDMDAAAITRLNDKMWNKFDSADWSKTKFIVSYMIEDDYDPTGYQMLLSHIRSYGVQMYGKGIHGRHNDNTGGIVNWFVSQYEKVLTEDFNRRIEK